MDASAESSTGLRGPALAVAAFALALSNFMVVLDTTIANVSVPHIAGGLAITPSQGTWIITSYSVAEAICVPLTGFLAVRFGSVKTFLVGMVGFAAFSMLCGFAPSLALLVLFRVGQGFCGGPLMPLTQTLLMRIFPKEQQGAAMGLWAMTTITAPILGPILGGVISDGWSWRWIFFINLPIAVFCALANWRFLPAVETAIAKLRIDRVGLVLMVVWIGALQVMLDLGHDRDWFNDPLIVALAVIAAIGFAVFCAWEGTEGQPVVDIRIFRYRGYTASVFALAFAFGTYFVSIVIIPQWLQTDLGYTATWAGYATALTGVTGVLSSFLVGRFGSKVDPRILVAIGIGWMGMTTFIRLGWTSGANFWSFALPQLLQGVGLPLFVVPITSIALGSVKPAEIASAAGVMSFLRTMAAAIGTSIATTAWDDHARFARNELVAAMHAAGARNALEAKGMSLNQVRGVIDQSVAQESLTLATDHLFLVSAIVFFCAAAIIWIAPKPQRPPAGVGAH